MKDISEVVLVEADPPTNPDPAVACVVCGTLVDFPMDGPFPKEEHERRRVLDTVVIPFARRIADECQYAETLDHFGERGFAT